MVALGLFLSLASLPGYTSVSIPAGWAAMSLTLPWFQWRKLDFGILHWLFVAFLVYVTASLYWTTAPAEGGFRLWQMALVFLAFCLGSSLDSLRQFILGFAIGCAVSSAIAIAQHFGFQPVLFFSMDDSSGLFYNSAWLGCTLALASIACLSHGYITLGLLQLPGIYLSHSRGALLTLGLGITFIFWRSNRLLTIAILAGLLAVTLSASPHEAERLAFWRAAYMYLTPFGNGAGSFSDMWIVILGALRHPESTHNDPLQLAFELGLGTAPVLAIAICCLWQRNAAEWPLFASFVFLSFFTFPLFHPLAACLAGLSAGRIAASLPLPWHSLPACRRWLLLRYYPPAAAASVAGFEDIPIQQRASQ